MVDQINSNFLWYFSYHYLLFIHYDYAKNIAFIFYKVNKNSSPLVFESIAEELHSNFSIPFNRGKAFPEIKEDGEERLQYYLRYR